MKALKAFIKSFEALQRSVKIKLSVNFYFNTTFWNIRRGKGYDVSLISLYIILIVWFDKVLAFTIIPLDAFHATGRFLYPVFSDVFRGIVRNQLYEMG